jgi:dienelactone hydrolase
LGRRVAGVVALAAALAACASGSSSPVGAYRLAGGGVASVVEQPRGLRFVDYSTGALRDFTAADVHGAARIPLRVQSATIPTRGARLAARLLVPQGPAPAIVIVPGSIKATRDSYDLWAYFFASCGFEVLSYDKRGVGASTGRYTSEPSKGNIATQATDALAAVAWLKRHGASRIGLSGGSMAGWVIPLAAARTKDVAFAAIQSGPAMSVGRQRAYARLTQTGKLEPPPSDEQIRAALAAQPDAGFDPRPSLAALHIPVLWQLGAVDKRQYTPETIAILSALANPNIDVRVYPGGAHSLRLTANGLQSEERAAMQFVPGLFQDLGRWLGEC